MTMAGSLTAYAERGLLNLFFRAGTFSLPAAVYIGLSKADPGHDGSAVSEPSGGGYARQLVAWDAAATSAGAARSANTAEIAFPAPSAAWGTLTHFFGADAVTGGNLLFSGTLTSSVVHTTQTVTFPAGDLDISLSGVFSDAINEDLLDHVLGTATFTAPLEIWAALSTADPGVNGGTIAEVTGGDYERILISGWNPAASETDQSRLENSFSHDFAAAGSGTATWLAYFSAVTGGTYYGRAELLRSRDASQPLRIRQRGLDLIAA